jgi:formylglycine-generating enzyme required for sulfatase activity
VNGPGWTGDCTPGEEFPKARRVGLLEPNPEGIYDLAGNVTEWTADLFSMEAYEACPEPRKNPCFGCADKTGGSELLRPDVEPWERSHVTRGSALDTLSAASPQHVVFSRSQYRDRGSTNADAPAPQSFNIGFRCAYPAQPER